MLEQWAIRWFTRAIEPGKWWATLLGAILGFGGSIATGLWVRSMFGPSEWVFLLVMPGPFVLALCGAAIGARLFPKSRS